MRLELHLRGVSLGELGSYRDMTLRSFLVKEKVRDSHKLLASMASSLGNSESAVKQFDMFSDATLYQSIKGDRNKEMQEYYNKHVRHLRPEIYADEDGKATVRGLTNVI